MPSIKEKSHYRFERNARQEIFDDLFNDYNANRFSVYRANFVRGIFFGFGSVLGGTILVAAAVWSLNAIGFLVPALADFINNIVDVMHGRV